MKKILLMLAFALVTLAGCKKETTEPEPIAVKVSQIKLVGMPTEFTVGRSFTISAVITPDDATDKSVTFTSSNPEVATVEYTESENNYSLALLKAVGPGKATITATANDGSGAKAEAEVDVLPATKMVSDISITMSKSEVKVGYMVRATATVSPEDATNREITWSSSNTSIAKVRSVEGANNKVDVIGVSPGTVIITATAKDGSGVTASVEVTVIDAGAVTGVDLDKEMVEIYVGATETVKAQVKPADATNKNVTWTIGNPEIATVNDGVVTGVAEGETTLTVTTVDGGFTASIPVKVVHSPVGSLLGEWSGKVYHGVTIVQGSNENSIRIHGFPDQHKINLQGYVMSDNTIRIPKQIIESVYGPGDTGENETIILKNDFIPLNGDELVIQFDSDHIYISDAWELGWKALTNGEYCTYRGEADTLIRVQ